MYANTHMLDPVSRILLASRTAGTVIDAGIKAIVRQIDVEPQEDITATMDVDDTRVEDPVRLGVAVEVVTINRQVHSRSDRPILHARRTSAIRILGSSSRFILAWNRVSGEMLRHPWVTRR